MSELGAKASGMPGVPAWRRLRAELSRQVQQKLRPYWLPVEMRRWRARRAEILAAGREGFHCRVEDLGLLPAELKRLLDARGESGEVLVADVDRDGGWQSRFGPVPGVNVVSAETFLPRTRARLQIVASGGQVGVKKHYGGDRLSFLNELQALHRLAEAGCRVPRIQDVDFDALTITQAYIPGETLRERLIRHGAALRSRDLVHNTEFSALPVKERKAWRIQEGRRALAEAVSPETISSAFALLCAMLDAGVTHHDVTYGNIIVERKSGLAYWIDFAHVHHYPDAAARGVRFQRECARDVREFNRVFGTDYPYPKERQA